MSILSLLDCCRKGWIGFCRRRVAQGQKGKAMSAEINIYNPEELGPPMGQYTHVTRVRANEFLFVAGMLSGDAAGNVIGEGEFDVQTAQVFRNIETALKSAGASRSEERRVGKECRS